jgi:2-dehydropantoate 2-reductase
VIGAGAVGGTIAALLDRGGHEVEVTARGQGLDAIRSGGIALSGGWGDHVARVVANPILTRAPELAIVATKAIDAEAAVRENADLLRGVPIVVVQNGIRSISTVRAILPRTDVVGGLALFAASYLEPGSVSVTTTGSTYLGNDGHGLDVEYAANILGTVMPVHATHNFEGAQWTKLMVNQINALPAITDLSVQQTITNRRLRLVLVRSMREAVAIALEKGVKFEKLQGLSHGILQTFRRMPPAVGQILPFVMKWRMGPTPNPGSTLQSIRRGHKTEIDYLNGAIVDAARATGRSAPVNAKIVELVHGVESTGSFLSPERVAEEFSFVSSAAD